MALDKVRSSAAAVMGLVVAAAALLSPPAPGSFNDEGTCLVAAFIPAPSVVVAAGRPPPAVEIMCSAHSIHGSSCGF